MSFTCSVCLEDLFHPGSSAVSIPCGHVYHDACIRKCLTKSQETCPECRRRFRREAITRLFFSMSDAGASPAQTRDAAHCHRERSAELAQTKEELQKARDRLRQAEEASAAAVEQSVVEQSRLTEAMRRAQDLVAAVLGNSAELQAKLRHQLEEAHAVAQAAVDGERERPQVRDALQLLWRRWDALVSEGDGDHAWAEMRLAEIKRFAGGHGESA